MKRVKFIYNLITINTEFDTLKKMGSQESIPAYTLVKKDKPILYTIDFKGGELGPFYEDSKLPQISGEVLETDQNTISIELLLNCEKGDIGPISINNLRTNESRTIELWHGNRGLPIYCIVVMYRGKNTFFPKWSIPKCNVKTKINNIQYVVSFKHPQLLSGGDAVVYSLTMASYDQKQQNINNSLSNMV